VRPIARDLWAAWVYLMLSVFDIFSMALEATVEEQAEPEENEMSAMIEHFECLNCEGTYTGTKADLNRLGWFCRLIPSRNETIYLCDVCAKHFERCRKAAAEEEALAGAMREEP